MLLRWCVLFLQIGLPYQGPRKEEAPVFESAWERGLRQAKEASIFLAVYWTVISNSTHYQHYFVADDAEIHQAEGNRHGL